MRYIFVDFEMNPIEYHHKEARKICRQEIIEIGAVKLDEQYKEIDCYKRYVKPEFSQEITKKYAALTGITTHMVSQEATFNEVILDFISWCGEEDYVIYAWSGNDLSQLNQEMKLKKTQVEKALLYAIKNWHDFQREFCDLLGFYKPISLQTAVSSIGNEFSGQMHDALWDARNTAAIYSLSKDKEAFYKKMQPIIDLLHPKEEEGCMLGDLFDFSKIVI